MLQDHNNRHRAGGLADLEDFNSAVLFLSFFIIFCNDLSMNRERTFRESSSRVLISPPSCLSDQAVLMVSAMLTLSLDIQPVDPDFGRNPGGGFQFDDLPFDLSWKNSFSNVAFSPFLVAPIYIPVLEHVRLL